MNGPDKTFANYFHVKNSPYIVVKWGPACARARPMRQAIIVIKAIGSVVKKVGLINSGLTKSKENF